MKYKIALIDDEEDARELIKIHLARHPDLEIIGEAQDGHEALDLIQNTQPDIVLLDIQMPEMNGLELIEHIQEMPYFIFITAYDRFALKAFELNAIDYLLKPFAESRFDQALQKAREFIQKDKIPSELYRHLLDDLKVHSLSENTYLQRLSFKTGPTTSFIPVEEIILIEADDQYVQVHGRQKSYTLRQSMDYLEKRLNPQFFFRSHRSTIIHLREVRGIEQVDSRHSIILLNQGYKARLSQGRKALFQARLGAG